MDRKADRMLNKYVRGRHGRRGWAKDPSRLLLRHQEKLQNQRILVGGGRVAEHEGRSRGRGLEGAERAWTVAKICCKKGKEGGWRGERPKTFNPNETWRKWRLWSQERRDP